MNREYIGIIICQAKFSLQTTNVSFWSAASLAGAAGAAGELGRDGDGGRGAHRTDTRPHSLRHSPGLALTSHTQSQSQSEKVSRTWTWTV